MDIESSLDIRENTTVLQTHIELCNTNHLLGTML
jgi:hypothetical protein